MFHCDQAGENMPWMLHRKLSPSRSMMIPHHPACKGHPFDWTGFDEALAPVVEIVQDHRGSCERPGGVPCVPSEASDDPSLYLDAALSQGRRFGFIGGGVAAYLLGHVLAGAGDAVDGRGGRSRPGWGGWHFPLSWRPGARYPP